MEDVFNDFINYLEKLDDKDWNTLVDFNWAIKDVVSHLVGWEEECVKVLISSWKTGEEPWFLEEQDYLQFNRQNVEKYKNYNPKELLEKWRYFVKVMGEEIKKIGEKNLKGEKWAWIFDDSHYLEHWEQIKRTLRNKHNNS